MITTIFWEEKVVLLVELVEQQLQLTCTAKSQQARMTITKYSYLRLTDLHNHLSLFSHKVNKIYFHEPPKLIKRVVGFYEKKRFSKFQ